jgi:hypothetical protein
VRICTPKKEFLRFIIFTKTHRHCPATSEDVAGPPVWVARALLYSVAPFSVCPPHSLFRSLLRRALVARAEPTKDNVSHSRNTRRINEAMTQQFELEV